MNDDKARIRFNDKEVKNPAARKVIGTVLIAVFVVLFLAGLVMLFVLPYLMLIILLVILGIAAIAAVIARPLDWILKKLGRVGIIHKRRYGYAVFIFDRRMFAKVTPKETSAELETTQE